MTSSPQNAALQKPNAVDRLAGAGRPDADAKSWYVATSHARAAPRRLQGEHRHDIAVVGAGLAGLTVALELAQKGYDVAVVEAKTAGWGASGRNGGQLVTGFTKSLNQIRKYVGDADAERLWQMAEEGKQIVRDRIGTHAIDCNYKPGYMYTAVKQSHVVSLKDMLDSWQGYGYRAARWLDRDETRALVSCPHYLGGIIDDENGHLHPLNYTLGLARAAEAAGATIYENTPAIGLVEGPKPAVLTPEGRLNADQVVLAGNALLGPISRSVATRVNAQIAPVATYIIATETMPQARAEAIIPGDIAVSDIMFVVNYYRRSADHRILFGGGLDWSGLTFSDVCARMQRAMHKWLPATKGLSVEYCWGGYVDMTYTMLPSVGRLTNNIFYVHGFSGNGLSLTGIAGRITAEAVAGTAERFDVFSRLPTPKFPGGPLLRQPIAVAGALWYKLKDLLP